jgi:hypothetical protein
MLLYNFERLRYRLGPNQTEMRPRRSKLILVGNGRAVPPELARLLAEAGFEIAPARPVTLRALRESVGRTQGEVATRVAMTQPQLSRVEARRDHLISTVRKYVRALDGQIEVAAIVNGSRFVLRDV